LFEVLGVKERGNVSENVADSELEKDPKFREWIEKLGLKWEDYVKYERDTKRALRNQYRREHGIPY
jgi:hypothetical protein